MKNRIVKLAFYAAIISLAACSSYQTVEQRGDYVAELVEEAGFEPLVFQHSYYAIQGFQQQYQPSDKTLRVYIEGDGLAFFTRSRPSLDPTPINPLALKLAIQDDSENTQVVYLARPCQYTAHLDEAKCEKKVWTSHRFSQQVVESMNQAVDELLKGGDFERLELIGFSGGGAIVSLLAERRGDVALLVTVAGNLDHVSWVRDFGFTPLSGSLDPMEQVQVLKSVPQLHFVGAEDTLISERYAQNFVAKQGGADDVRIIVVPEFTHSCCWSDHWQQMMQKYGF